MSTVLRNITFDASDPLALARFWSAVTGWPVSEDSAEDEAYIPGPGPLPGLLFLRVPEGKAAKNRVHFDLQPQYRDRDAEVERLLALGATSTGDFRNDDGTGWVVMADPEGNEFCVERSAAERAER